MPGNESEAAAQLDAYLDRAGSRAPAAQQPPEPASTLASPTA